MSVKNAYSEARKAILIVKNAYFEAEETITFSPPETHRLGPLGNLFVGGGHVVG